LRAPAIVGSHLTLWRLLEVMCGVAIPSAAFGEAKARRVGVLGEVFVLVPALLLGVFNIWTVHRAGYAAYQQSKKYSDSAQAWWARFAYLGLGLWIIISLLVGVGIGSMTLRAVGK
jgi:TRAP-type mannitol/chloroaromatic compound transport system permease small subunit